MRFIAGCLVGAIALLGIGGSAIVLSGLVPPAAQPMQAALAQSTPVSDMVVTLSERYLNYSLGKGLPAGGQVRDVQLDLHPNNLASATATIPINAFITVRPKATLRLGVGEGKVTIDVMQVDVGGLGIPNSLIEPQIDDLKRSAESQLNSQLSALAASSGLRLYALSTGENTLTLSFTQ